MKKCILMLFGLGLFWVGNAQSLSPAVISSQGSISKGNSIQLEWTIGEMATQTIRSPGGLVTEGFHQPLLEVEIQEGDKNLSPLADDFNISIAPNPVKALLAVDIQTGENQQIYFELLDPAGRRLQLLKAGIPVEGHQIDMSNYPSGMYYLRFTTQEGELIQTFKVSKVE